MYMAEMRTVTTLFVKLDSYSPEKHKNLLSLQVGFEDSKNRSPPIRAWVSTMSCGSDALKTFADASAYTRALD